MNIASKLYASSGVTEGFQIVASLPYTAGSILLSMALTSAVKFYQPSFGTGLFKSTKSFENLTFTNITHNHS